MSRNQEAIYADYILGRFTLGYDYLAAFLASVLFERIINKKLERQNPKIYCELYQGDKADLAVKISKLNRKTLDEDVLAKIPLFKQVVKKGIKSKLHEFRDLRNELMHADESIDRTMLSETRKSKLCELILYVVAETNPEFFSQKLQNIKKLRLSQLREAVDEITADYLIREIDETMVRRYDRTLTKEKKRQYFVGIDSGDFDDLFALRKKLVFLRHDLRQWLRQSEEIYHHRMRMPVLSTIDTTSGYIWMPIIHDMKHLAEIERPNIVMPSVSIVATPLNIQVYLGFGGKAIKQRIHYLDFITEAKGDFSEFIESLNEEDRADLKFFDTSWYAFVTEQSPAIKEGGDVNITPSIVDGYRRELEPMLASGAIATGGKLFCGFILGRSNAVSGGISRDVLFHKVEVMLDLYHRFLKFSLPLT